MCDFDWFSKIQSHIVFIKLKFNFGIVFGKTDT